MSHTAFLSCSFAPVDVELLDMLRAILARVGVTCYLAEHVPRIPDDVIGLILKHRLFVAVLTDRDGAVPPAITFEIGVAMSNDRRIILLRDDVVPVQQFYAGRHQAAFNRDRLLKGDQDEIRRVEQAVIEIARWYGEELGTSDPDVARRYEFAMEQTQLLGSVILRYYNEVIHANPNANPALKNFPTEADHRSNRIILEALARELLTRRDGIVSEETSKALDIRNEIEAHEFTWIIDPIDGTLNFAHGFPYFCISLGLLRKGEPELGVVYNPTTQELYCGRRGFPSEVFELNFGRRRPIELRPSPKTLSECIVMMHLSARPDPRRVTIPVIDSIADRCRGIRVLGSGQMALISLALGQFDIFFNYSTNIWDVVPGRVILRGAGGYATSSLEQPDLWRWNSLGILAARNRQLGEEFASLVRPKIGSEFPSLF